MGGPSSWRVYFIVCGLVATLTLVMLGNVGLTSITQGSRTGQMGEHKRIEEEVSTCPEESQTLLTFGWNLNLRCLIFTALEVLMTFVHHCLSGARVCQHFLLQKGVATFPADTSGSNREPKCNDQMELCTLSLVGYQRIETENEHMSILVENHRPCESTSSADCLSNVGPANDSGSSMFAVPLSYKLFGNCPWCSLTSEHQTDTDCYRVQYVWREIPHHF